MPQTAASVEERIKILKTLTKRFPGVVWKICIEQIKPGYQSGHESYRPRWRSDASGAGQVVMDREGDDFCRKALDLLISWPSYDENTLGDLVESLQGIPEENQAKVWDLINEWSQKAGNEAAGAALRERIRKSTTRRSRHRKLGEVNRDRAREAYESLQPHDPVIRHGWLFADNWVQEPADEIEEEEFDYRKYDERIDKLRRDAVVEIWAARGFEGVTELLADSGAAGTVGRYVALCVTGATSRVDFIRHCLSLDGNLRSKAEWCLQGVLLTIEEDSRAGVLQTTAEELPAKELTRLFVCAPFQASTWRLLDSYDEDIRAGYWKDVFPSWDRYTPAELTELIDRFLDVRRPRAAFHAVHMDFKDIETFRLKRLLRDVATVNTEPTGHFQPDRYYISAGLISLDGRPGVSADEMAQLEFLFIDALDRSEHGMPNLERQIAQSPAVFVQAVVFAYKRSDEGKDPPEWSIENPKQRAAVASAAYRLLGKIKRIPGTDDNKKINGAALATWLTEVRRLCREYACTDIGDRCLGKLLAKAPGGENGIWPCESVCEAMEEIASQEIGEGFNIGVYNSRGFHERAEGGVQERELATKYRAWAERLHFYYPYVGGVLESIAKGYDHDAKRWDSEAKITRRLCGY